MTGPVINTFVHCLLEFPWFFLFHPFLTIITMLARFVRKFPVQRLARLTHTEPAAEAAPKMFGGKHAREEWEIPVYVFMVGGIAMGVIGLWAQKNTSIVSWARSKAEKKEEN